MVETLEIISQIPDKTYKDFTRFLKSPYHNSNKQLVKLMVFKQKNIFDLKAISTKILKKKSIMIKSSETY